MSELKEFNSERIYWAVEQVERVAGDIDRLRVRCCYPHDAQTGCKWVNRATDIFQKKPK